MINNDNHQNGTGNPSPTIDNFVALFKYKRTKNIETHNTIQQLNTNAIPRSFTCKV